MDSNIPYYLRQNVDTPMGAFDFFAPENAPASLSGTPTVTSVWEDLANGTSETVDAVFDAASGTWQKIENAGENLVSGIKETASSYFSWIGSTLMWVLVIGLVVIWIVAKSGIIGQAAQIVK